MRIRDLKNSTKKKFAITIRPHISIGPPPNPKAQAAQALASGISDSAKQSKAELNANFDRISKKPESLLSQNAGKDALAALAASGANQISFQSSQGFDGVNEFQPAGWSVQIGAPPAPAKAKEETKGPAMWPMGIGMAMMNGCYLRGYQPGDPCYAFARKAKRCIDLLDGAQFIGVGFDGRGFYSSDSRKVSIVQRVCAKKVKFLGKLVPDIMAAYGLWDYAINTESFQDAKQYVKYLQEKAGSAETETMFQAEAESLQRSKSSGGNFGVIGALAGAAVGAYAGGAQGAGMGAQVGAALGQSIGFNSGSGSGSSSTDQNAQRGSSRSTSQSGSKGSGNTVNMIALLEADMKLYEIALNELKPDDMSADFFADIMELPNSYFEVGAGIVFQRFISKWGTHFIKSAKFGGELTIMKTSKKESKMSEEQFSERAQDEFSGMLGTLKSSFKQKEKSYGFLGFGSKSRSVSQKATATQQQTNSAKVSNAARGEQKNGRSEFIKTTIKVLGGDPAIGAAITDFYTPRFREVFVKWLNSIDDYVRPYEFSLGKISSLLSVGVESLFSDTKPNEGCFGPDVKKDNSSNKHYFERKIYLLDENNNTVDEVVRNYCPYGTSKKAFVEDMDKKKLALERAESIYMAEGPSSTSSFDIDGGPSGCELDSLEYLNGNDKIMKTWPTWAMTHKTNFKAIFEMPEDLPSIPRNAEFIVKYFRNRWYTKTPGQKFQLDSSCPAGRYEGSKYICIAEVPMTYSEQDGTIKLDLKTYEKFKVSVPFWLQQPLGRLEVMDRNTRYNVSQLGTVGRVPCNVKWSNTHQISASSISTCIYFKAASAGSINIIFAGLPQNSDTWYSIRISSGSISFYQAMKLAKHDISITSGSLGSATLFEPYFICISHPDRSSLSLQYGKAPKDSEIGNVFSSFTFRNVPEFKTFFYAFGSGESKIMISDLRVIKGQPKIACQAGLVKDATGACQVQCHSECDGCHQANDPNACLRCKNIKVIDYCYFYCFCEP